MYDLTLISGDLRRTVSAADGALLSDLLRDNIPSFALPCAGNHTCGKCRVAVSGAVYPPDESERKLLRADEADIRLACACRIAGDVTVTLATEGASKIIAWNKTPDFARSETGCGLAVDIGTTTVAMQLFDRTSGALLAERLAENAQRGFGADVISRICNQTR